MTPVLAAIPYETFPELNVGPLTVRTFGLMVAVGIVVGVAITSRYVERFGVARDEMVSLATRLVIAGLVGARLTWVVTHWDEIDSVADVFAVWEGGLQFSGGFIAAILFGVPTFRRWDPVTRWRVLDGLALGLTVGLAFGRVGCYAVGEHLGGPSDFFLATRYEGGDTREGPLVLGEAIHNTSLYELLWLVVLAGVLTWLLARVRPPAGVAMGVFALWYGVARFLTDFLREYDDTVLGLTGAQWMCVVLVPVGVLVVARARERARRAAGEDDAVVGVDATDAGPPVEA